MLRAKDILDKLHEMSGPPSEVVGVDYANNDFDYDPELTTRVYSGQDDIVSLDAATSIGYDDEIEPDPLDGEYDDGDDEDNYEDGEETSDEIPDEDDDDLYSPEETDLDNYTYDDFDDEEEVDPLDGEYGQLP